MNNKPLIIFFLIIFSTFNSQNIWSQRDPLSKKITIKIDKQPIEKVLVSIENRARISFSYNSDILPLDSVVSANFEQEEIYKILNQLLQNKFTYKTTGQHIIILKKKTPSNPQKRKFIIKGSIIEAGTGIGIPYASIYEIYGKDVTLSDASGDFQLLTLPRGEYLGLAISKSNYKDTIIFVKTIDSSPIEVTLNPELLAVASISPVIENKIDFQGVEQSSFVPKFVRKDLIFHAKNILFYRKKLGQISFLPTLGSNYKFNGSTVNNISLNLLAGYSYGTNGLELGGLLNINRKELKGVQISGFGNITGEKTNGVQIAGFFNHSFGKVKGAQIAGFHNMVLDSIDGVQISGFSNILKGQIKGSQIAGFVNLTKKEVIASQFSGFANIALKSSKGVQCAGFVNVANGDQGWLQASGFANFTRGIMQGIQASGFTNITVKDATGIQACGFANYAGENMRGIQAAGFMNIAGKDIKGVQFAGFLNYAKKVKGVQVAFINIADTVSVASIGIFNFVKKGLHEISLGTNEMAGVNLQFNLGTYRFYSIFGYTYQPRTDIEINEFTFGFGTYFFGSRMLSLNMNLLASTNSFSFWDWEENEQYKFAFDLNIRLSRHFLVYVGASFNMLRYSETSTEFSNYPKNYLFPTSFEFNHNRYVFKGWPGASAGLKFRF